MYKFSRIIRVPGSFGHQNKRHASAAQHKSVMPHVRACCRRASTAVAQHSTAQSALHNASKTNVRADQSATMHCQASRQELLRASISSSIFYSFSDGPFFSPFSFVLAGRFGILYRYTAAVVCTNILSLSSYSSTASTAQHSTAQHSTAQHSAIIPAQSSNPSTCR